MPVRRLSAFLLVSVVAGCESSKVVAPGPDASSSPALVVTDVGGRASGHAAIVVRELTAKPEEYSFTARHVPGDLPVAAKGQMEFRSHRTEALGGTIRVHAEVVCLGMEAGLERFARIGAIIRQSTNETFFPVGSTLQFAVTDNGEGRNSPPDVASSPGNLVFATEEAARTYLNAFCQFGGPPEFFVQFPVEQGNIQVKG